MIDIKDDVSKLTTIPISALDRLSEKYEDCIGYAFYESKLGNRNITEFNLGFGNLIISNEEEAIRYKFIPSENLEKNLLEICNGKEPQLKQKLENGLVNRIINTYKDII